jgi:hypothetical protein
MASYLKNFTGDGSEVHFTADFPVLRLTDLAVVVDNVWLTLGTEYSVAGPTSAAVATLVTAPGVGAVVTLRSAVGYTPTDPAAVTTAAPTLNDTDTALWEAIGTESARAVSSANALVVAEAAARAAADAAIIASGDTPADVGLAPVTATDSTTTLAVEDWMAHVPATSTVSDAGAFAGYAGTATTGAPRIVLGGNAPYGVQPNGDGDDSCILVTRNLTGDSMFAHAVRDETAFESATDGAYASFDSFMEMKGATHYNHLRSFQARPRYSGSNSIHEVNGFSYTLIHEGTGTVDASYGIHTTDIQGAGTVTNNFAIYVAPMTKGASNVGIFVEDNDNYLLGKLTIAGDLAGAVKGTFSDDLTAKTVTAVDVPTAFPASGGVMLYGAPGSSYGAVKAFSDAGGTEIKLELNPGGGGITVGTTADASLITSILRGSGTLGTSAIAAGATATQNITVTGAKVGAAVACGGPATLEAGLLLFAYVSAADTVTLRVANNTAGSITPAGGQSASVLVFNP